MFNVDAKVMARIAPHIERVMIVDSQPSSARLLAEILKELGARQPAYAQTTERALEMAGDFEPQLLFIELEGPSLDGVELTHRLRRSALAGRRAPVVVMAAKPRASAILAARDAGAHEFLVRPFTAGHLFKRIENVTLKPRLWIEAKMYVGPDRRRFNSGEFAGSRKRRADLVQADKLDAAFTAAEMAFRLQLELYLLRPQQALEGMLKHASELQAAAFHHCDPDLGAAINSLHGYLARSVERGDLEPDVVEQHLMAIRTLRDKVNRLDGPSRERLLLKLANTSAANLTEGSAASPPAIDVDVEAVIHL